MLSPVMAATKYEIWVYARPEFRCEVGELGLFDSEGDAVRVAAAVQMWLHVGVWSESVFGPLLCLETHPALMHEDRKGLLMLPQTLREGGIDPARTMVTAVRLGTGVPCSHLRPAEWSADPADDDADDDDDADATTVEPVEFVWSSPDNEED